jgi:hypothetical protein
MLHGHAAPCRSSAGLTGRSAAAALRGHVSRVAVVTRAGLLDFFNPGAPKAGGAKRGRAQEIVDELLELTEGTDGGIKASNAVKDEVEQLVRAVQAGCQRSAGTPGTPPAPPAAPRCPASLPAPLLHSSSPAAGGRAGGLLPQGPSAL